jgi:hypothetical protein
MRIALQAGMIFAPLCGGIAFVATLDLGIAVIATLAGGIFAGTFFGIAARLGGRSVEGP